MVYSSLGGDDVFVVKLDSSGATIWGTAFRGPQSDSGNGIAADGTGNVYATGHFSGTDNFNALGSPVNLVSLGQEDVYLVKLNTNGALVWAKRFGAGSFDAGSGVAVDAASSAYRPRTA